MSAVQLNHELNDSTISTSQTHDVTKKHKKRKHRASGNDQPTEVSPSTTTVDGVPPEEKRTHRKKKKDKSSENNVSIVESSQSVAVESKRKRHKSKSEEKPLKDAETEIAQIEEDQDTENVTTSEEKKKGKKKKRDKSSAKNDSVVEPSQSDVVENKRKRRKSQIEEEPSKETEIEPEPTDQELTQGSKRKRRRTNQAEDVRKETEKGAELDSTEVNGVEEGDKKIIRRSNRKSVLEKRDMSDEDQQMLLNRMLEILPEYDGISYLQRLEEFNWRLVKFSNYSAENCHEQFNRTVAKVRRSRTLAEIIHDAQKSRVGDNASRRMRTRAKPILKCSALQLYLKRKIDAYLQKHPESRHEDAKEKYRNKWTALSDVEKVKYIRKAEDHNTKLQEEIEEKCRTDPLYKPPRRRWAKLLKEEQKILDKVDGIPRKPLRTGYLLFCEIMKERVKAEKPDISNTDMTAELGHRWSALAKRKQEHYKKKAEKKKHKYLEFLEAHPEIEAKVNAGERSKTVIKKASKPTFDGEPVKPPTSGYMLFCKEILTTLKDVSSRDRMQEASKRWAALPEEKKSEYNKEMKAAMECYISKLDAFKEKLSPEGLKYYEEIRKKASPRTPKKSPPDPSKEITGKQKNPSSDNDKETVTKPKKAASKKAKEKNGPMVVKLWSKSPTPNNNRAEDIACKINNGHVSDTSSELF